MNPRFNRLVARVLIFYFCLPCNPAPAVSEGVQAEASYQKALRFREEGRLLEAERRLAEVLQTDPGRAVYYFEMANIYAARHDELSEEGSERRARAMLEKVGRELKTAVMLDPAFTPARFNLGVVYKRLGDYEKARQIFQQVAGEAEKNKEPGVRMNAFMQIGSVYEEQGFFNEAREAYMKAKELDYLNPSIDSAMADLELREKEYRELQRLRDAHERIGHMGRPMEFTPFSHAGHVQAERYQSAQDSAGLQGAIPYLGMMLVEQFLNREGRGSRG